MKNLLKFIYYLFRELFIFSLIALFLLLIAEDFQPGFVTLWFDWAIILKTVLITGLLSLFFSKAGE